MTALLAEIWLNTEPEAVARGYMTGDQLTRACEITWGFLAPDLHAGELRLHLPGRRTWALEEHTPIRIATAVLDAMRGPREGLEDWQREAIRPWLDSGGRPFAAGDVMRLSAPGPYPAETWDELPAVLARMYGHWWNHIELRDAEL